MLNVIIVGREMAKKQRKTGLIVTIVILAITVLGVSAFALVRGNSSPSKVTNETSTSALDTTNDEPKDADPTDMPTGSEPTKPAVDPTKPTVDPATLTSVAIEPLGITVFYSKGTPGFDFAIKKTASKTEYVEFTSTDLIGTKCTDDTGIFASIIKNPSSEEDKTTISETVKVGSDSYGLSLASASCTTNSELLTKYQSGFKAGFSSLKTL